MGWQRLTLSAATAATAAIVVVLALPAHVPVRRPDPRAARNLPAVVAGAPSAADTVADAVAEESPAIALDPAIRGDLEGLVLDDAGRPRGGVRVVVVPDGAASPFLAHGASRPTAESTSQPSGRYRVQGIEAPAVYLVYARDGALVARTGPVSVEPRQATRADVSLQRPGGIRIRVAPPDAVWSARVQIVRRDVGLRRLWDLPLKLEDGPEFNDLLPIPHEIHVCARGFQPTLVVIPVEAGRVIEHEIVLERCERAADTDGDAPTTDRNTEVRFRLPIPAAEAFDLRFVCLDTLTPDSDGRFVMPIMHADGSVRVAVRAGDREYASGEIFVRPGETLDIGTIAPLRRGSLSGAVLAPSGHPVAGALVSAMVPLAQPVKTDASGRFRFDHVPLIPIRLFVQADGHPNAWPWVEPGEDVRLYLPLGSELRGRLVDMDGEAVPGAELLFYAAYEDGSLDRERWWYARVDSRGRFRVLLPPGRVRSCFGLPERQDAVGPVTEVRAGETAEIEVRLPWSLALWH